MIKRKIGRFVGTYEKIQQRTLTIGKRKYQPSVVKPIVKSECVTKGVVF